MNKYIEWLLDHKKQIIIICGILFFILLLLGIGIWNFYFNSYLKDNSIIENKEILVKKSDKDTNSDIGDNENNEINREIIENLVVVDVKGAVNNPGVYKIPDTSRVTEVLTLAGGVRDEADLSVINLSKKVFDEMVIIIYTKDEVNNFIEVKKQEEEKQEKCIIVEEKIINNACVYNNDATDNIIGAKEEQKELASIVSLNEATKEELMTLSGIGESKALLIIEYRETNNGFKTIEEIKNIKGIGDSIFEKIKDRIRV